MNQKMKKLLALLLALVMVLALAACGNDAGNDQDEDDDNDKTSQTDDKAGNEEDDKQEEKTDEERVIGQWAISTNIGIMLEERIAQNTDGYELASDEEMLLMMNTEFTEDGQYTFSFTADEDSVNRYTADLNQNMVDYTYQKAADQGLDKETFDQQFQTRYEMSLEEYMAASLATSVETLLDTFHSSNVSGYYKLDSESGLIYIASSESALEEETDYLEYAFDGDTLVISDMISDGKSIAEPMEDLGYKLPWQMERQ